MVRAGCVEVLQRKFDSEFGADSGSDVDVCLGLINGDRLFVSFISRLGTDFGVGVCTDFELGYGETCRAEVSSKFDEGFRPDLCVFFEKRLYCIWDVVLAIGSGV